MRLLKRLVQRLLILGLGIFSAWLIVFVVFEDADRRLPWFLAAALAYGIAAYVVLPRAIRMGLKILQRKLVPSFTVTGDGLPGDPVNVALIWTLPVQPNSSIEHRDEIRIALSHRAAVCRPFADALQVGKDTRIVAQANRLEKSHRGKREYAHDVGGRELAPSKIGNLAKARLDELHHAI